MRQRGGQKGYVLVLTLPQALLQQSLVGRDPHLLQRKQPSKTGNIPHTSSCGGRSFTVVLSTAAAAAAAAATTTTTTTTAAAAAGAAPAAGAPAAADAST